MKTKVGAIGVSTVITIGLTAIGWLGVQLYNNVETKATQALSISQQNQSNIAVIQTQIGDMDMKITQMYNSYFHISNVAASVTK